jgi:hypothetical protein
MSARASRTRTPRDLLLIAGLFALLVVLANPLHNFPIGDDWEYARTVQQLLTTGQFYRSPVLQPTALFPAVWGALFSAVFGFSFTVLRLSTLPLAAGTLLAFYLILGELSFPPAWRLLGTLTLMVAPLFMFNALSFMTDVPCLFWLMLGLWCSLRGFRLGRPVWVLAGSACGALSFLTRQLGLALPVAVALAVLAYRPRADWPRWLAASLGLPLAAVLLFYGWEAVSHRATWADSARTTQGTLQFIFNPQLPAALARRVIIMLVSLNMYMLPIWLAFSPQAGQAWLAFKHLGGRLQAAATLLGFFFFASITFFGLRGDWWPYTRGSLTNAGLWPSLAYFAFPADVRPPFLPQPFWIVLTYIGTALAVALALNLAVRFVRALRQPGEPANRLPVPAGPRWRRGPVEAWRFTSARLERIGPARGLVYATLLVLLALTLVYPLFFERYFLPILPLSIVLLLEAARRIRPLLPLAAVSLLAIGIFSVGLMWDYFDWHAVRWTESQALVSRGLPLEKLDAGYDWSGWFLSDEAYAYVEAEKLPVTIDIFHYVIDPEYMVTFTAQPGYQAAQAWPFYSPFRPHGADHLLLLKRVAP